jgi:signal transduction histidine kinase
VNAILSEGRIQVLSALDDNQVKITISDDGVGIPEDSLDQIFEIGFSSTRDHVKMGTSLMTTYRVVNEHGGMINIDSEVGKGTTVSLFLPVERSL